MAGGHPTGNDDLLTANNPSYQWAFKTVKPSSPLESPGMNCHQASWHVPAEIGCGRSERQNQESAVPRPASGRLDCREGIPLQSANRRIRFTPAAAGFLPTRPTPLDLPQTVPSTRKLKGSPTGGATGVPRRLAARVANAFSEGRLLRNQRATPSARPVQGDWRGRQWIQAADSARTSSPARGPLCR